MEIDRRVVWKYRLVLGGCVLHMPSGAKVLHLALQDEMLTVWVLVDPDARKIQHLFSVVGTGHPMLPGQCHAHVGTVIDKNGFVWHCFDRGEIVATRHDPEMPGAVA